MKYSIIFTLVVLLLPLHAEEVDYIRSIKVPSLTVKDETEKAQLSVSLGKKSGIGNKIGSFKIVWNGKTIPIEDRFWNDLGGMWLEKLHVPKRQLTMKEEEELERKNDWLKQPKIIVSADGGTLLITWARPEE